MSALALCGFACAPRPVATLPPPVGDQTVRISGRFSVIAPDFKQSGRFSWHRGVRSSRFRFLGPLNTVVGEVYCAGEEAFVANRRSRTCWEGSFRDLVAGWWGIPVDFETLRLLADGTLSAQDPLPEVEIERLSPRPDRSPETIVLRQGETILKLTLGARRPGMTSVREPERAGYRLVPLEQLVPDG